MTDAALQNMSSWPTIPLALTSGQTELLDKTTFQTKLNEFREQIMNSEESTVTDVLLWYTSVNAAMLDHLTNQIKEADTSGVWRLTQI